MLSHQLALREKEIMFVFIAGDTKCFHKARNKRKATVRVPSEMSVRARKAPATFRNVQF